MLDADLLRLLACPRCQGPLREDAAQSALLCPACALAFPLRQAAELPLPVLLAEEARPLNPPSSSAPGNQP